MADQPREPRPTTMGGILWDVVKKSLPYNFIGQQLSPESYLKPNERLRPGPNEGWQYELKPGEVQTDTGVLDEKGQPLTFVPRPGLSTLMDLFPQTGGAPKGAEAVASGIYRTQREVVPSLIRNNPERMDQLGLLMEAMHKRGSQGYKLPSKYGSDFNEENLAKADKALTKVSTTEPLPRYKDAADRATNLGYDTPAVHVASSSVADPEALKKLSGSPWFDIDPHTADRGAFYLGDFDKPTGPLRSGAALNTGSDPRAYPFLIKDVAGEHPLPPGLHAQMPPSFTTGKWPDMPAQQNLEDIYHAIQAAPGYGENLGGAMEAAKQRYGSGFDATHFLKSQAKAREDVARMISQIYYQTDPANPASKILTPREEFKPAKYNATGLPHYTEFESGSSGRGWGKSQTPVHSPWQNELGSAGFSGARVTDEQTGKGYKTYAMFDPFGVRAVGAKFKDPNGNLLSGATPPGWLDQMWAEQKPQDQPR